VRDERADAPARTVSDQLTDLLRQNPGIGAKEFETQALASGLGRNRARDFLQDGIRAGVIRLESVGNCHKHLLIEGAE
jgi:hypothetical protein